MDEEGPAAKRPRQTCTICHDPIDGECVRPPCGVCGALYHPACIREWCRVKNTCPLNCREESGANVRIHTLVCELPSGEIRTEQVRDRNPAYMRLDGEEEGEESEEGDDEYDEEGRALDFTEEYAVISRHYLKWAETVAFDSENLRVLRDSRGRLLELSSEKAAVELRHWHYATGSRVRFRRDDDMEVETGGVVIGRKRAASGCAGVRWAQSTPTPFVYTVLVPHSDTETVDVFVTDLAPDLGCVRCGQADFTDMKLRCATPYCRNTCLHQGCFVGLGAEGRGWRCPSCVERGALGRGQLDDTVRKASISVVPGGRPRCRTCRMSLSGLERDAHVESHRRGCERRMQWVLDAMEGRNWRDACRRAEEEQRRADAAKARAVDADMQAARGLAAAEEQQRRGADAETARLIQQLSAAAAAPAAAADTETERLVRRLAADAAAPAAVAAAPDPQTARLIRQLSADGAAAAPDDRHRGTDPATARLLQELSSPAGPARPQPQPPEPAPTPDWHDAYTDLCDRLSKRNQWAVLSVLDADAAFAVVADVYGGRLPQKDVRELVAMLGREGKLLPERTCPVCGGRFSDDVLRVHAATCGT
eukprot:TRINITY_DN29682_c0_g1_i1.p1 TRINITY_DN29682_c0_g1~~TRINITY_DN29682_c0_g1_i1.p1  ORF type:complete len:608 (+),score=177.53 TRINITY_DN29682_c0_g1_i1:48-1826(+)